MPKVLSSKVSSSESSSAREMGQIECPRCGKHSVVQQTENAYRCLNCNFHRDLSRPGEESTLGLFVAALATVLVLVAIL